MKQQLIFTIILISLATACNPGSKGEDSPGQKETPVNNQSAYCYTSIKNKDSILLHIEINNDVVQGDLVYNFYEKDRNSGTITGQMKGDTIFADYSFISEGTGSVREVAFLKKGKNLVEGFGDAEERNGKMVFKSRQSLKFDENMALLKEVPCDK